MVTQLHVRAINDSVTTGRLSVGGLVFPCVIGRNGRSFRKREGDGKTPIGSWDVRPGYFRQDRQRHCPGGPPTKPLRRGDGWCDEAASGRYNRPVKLPLVESHEGMWRPDGAYDFVFPTSHNERPRVRGLGSAIFFHLTRPGVKVTEGCIAVSPGDMKKILSLCGPRTRLVVWPGQGGPLAAGRK